MDTHRNEKQKAVRSNPTDGHQLYMNVSAATDQASNSVETLDMPPSEVQIPSFDAGVAALLKFLFDLLDKCVKEIPEVVKEVDKALIEKHINRIYSEIWSLQKNCPQLKNKDSFRLLQLCFMIVPEYIKDIISLAVKRYRTVSYIMAAIRPQSTKGRPPADLKQKEELKKKQKRRMTHLNPSDIKERMEDDIPGNVAKYYYVAEPTAENGLDRVVIIDLQLQSFKPLAEDTNKFNEFLKAKKPVNSVPAAVLDVLRCRTVSEPKNTSCLTPQKRPREVLASDVYEDEYSTDVAEQGPRKSFRAAWTTSPRQGDVPLQPDTSAADTSEASDSVASGTEWREEQMNDESEAEHSTNQIEALQQHAPQTRADVVFQAASLLPVMDLFPGLSDCLKEFQHMNDSFSDTVFATTEAKQLPADTLQMDFSIEEHTMPDSLDFGSNWSTELNVPMFVNTAAEARKQSVGF